MRKRQKIQTMPWKIGLIGTGNIAAFWVESTRNLLDVSWYVKGITSDKATQFCAQYNIGTLAKDTDLDMYILAVNNDQIDRVILELPSHIPLFICAGFHQCQLPHVGYLYPLQTIHFDNLPALKEVPFLVEFTKTTELIGRKFLDNLQARYEVTTTKERMLAHTMAVFVNNFTYFICKEAIGALPPSLDQSLFEPLLAKTIQNTFAKHDLQTGPARRNDLHMIAQQGELLKAQHPELVEVYNAITHAIQKKYYEL